MQPCECLAVFLLYQHLSSRGQHCYKMIEHTEDGECFSFACIFQSSTVLVTATMCLFGSNLEHRGSSICKWLGNVCVYCPMPMCECVNVSK